LEYHTYILFSKNLNKFYTGSTSLTPQKRLLYHLGKHSGFTAKAKDWCIIYSQNHETIFQARAMEIKIKKRGAKRYLKLL